MGESKKLTRRERERGGGGEGGRDRQADKQIGKDRQAESQRDRQTERQRDRETDKERDRQTDRQRDRQIDRLIDIKQKDRQRETDKQRGRQTDKQADRQTKRQRDKERSQENLEQTINVEVEGRKHDVRTGNSCPSTRLHGERSIQTILHELSRTCVLDTERLPHASRAVYGH